MRPESGAPRASVSRTRTVVVPTASTRGAASIRAQAGAATVVPLAVEVVLLEALGRDRPERVETHVERDALDVEPRQELGREVQAGRRSGRGAALPRVDRLVPDGVHERLGDVRRQGRLAGGLALEAQQPPALAAMLEELDRPEALARAQPPRRARQALPQSATADPLEQEHLGGAASLPHQRDPRRDDARVVDDREPAPFLQQGRKRRCRTSPVPRS